MRARRLGLLLALLLLPTGQAGEPGGHDLVVLLDPGAHVPLPVGAIPLTVIPGFVLLDAPPALEQALRAMPGVARVDRGEPLEWHGAPSPPPPDHAERLTRADAASLAPFEVDGSGVTVAVVDSGIDATHPDLAGRVQGTWRLEGGAFAPSVGDADGHGTHVAGIVAGNGRSSGGRHAGVAPGASLVGLDISGRFTTTSAVLAYDWLHAHREELGLRVVVNAWGRATAERTFDPHDPEIRAIDRLVDAGVVVIFSASNHGPGRRTLSLEAQDPKVITVGAVDDAGQLMAYSARGPVTTLRGGSWTKPDLVAPGEQITGLKSAQAKPDATSDPDPLHRVLSGTSQAAPHVAGVVARMLQADPSLTPAQVAEALHARAIDLGAEGPDPDVGHGLLDAPDALRFALGQPLRRDNPLIVGGAEAYDDQALLGGPTTGGLLNLLPQPTDLWTTTLPVKPGATGLAFEIRLATPARSLEATLEGPASTLGPWTEATQEGGRTVLRGRAAEIPPGVWTLRLRGALPAGAQLESHAEVTLGPNAARAGASDPRYQLPDDAPRPAPGRARVLWDDVTFLAEAHPWAVVVATTALGGLLAWGAYALRQRKGAHALPLEPAAPATDAPPPHDPQPSRGDHA